MKHLLVIGLGGSIGAIFRYLISKNVQMSINSTFPYGTFIVNIMGAFLIGFLFYLFDYIVVYRDLKSFLTIGLLGALTTFSTYSLETVNLFKSGEIKYAFYNFVLNNFVCFVMVILGFLSSKLFLNIFK